MPNQLACHLEEIDQHERSIRDNIYIREFTFNESCLILFSGREIVEAEIDLKNILAIEPYGMCGISIRTPKETILLKNIGGAEEEGSLIDLKNEIVVLHKKYAPHPEDLHSTGNDAYTGEGKIEARVIVGQGDERHDIYMHEGHEDSNSYIKGISYGKFGELILHKHPRLKHAEITQVYINEDQILKEGDKILEVTETSGNGNSIAIDLTYRGRSTIRVNSVAPSGTEICEETEGMSFCELESREIALPDEGSLGFIRMPVDRTRSHPYIEIKQKAEVGAVINRGETICIVEIDDGSQSPGNQSVKAPCRLCITKSGDNFDTDSSIFMGGVLIEYLRLPERSSKYSEQGEREPIKEAKKAVRVIEGVDEFLSMVKGAYAFQVRDVLERIVNTERERIETERGLWKLGAGIIALGFGVSLDGFDAGDLFAGWTFSNIGGAAHQFVSKEQVEFLKKLQSEWLVLDRSPMDLRRRLGEPQGRFIGISRENRLDMFNIHQSGSRGFHMVELDYAGNIAKGFKDPQSLEVLQRSYDEENIGIISSHLYPSTTTPLKLCRTITIEEAKKKDPYFNQLSKAGPPFRVVYSDDTEGVMYKIQIPHHSDY